MWAPDVTEEDGSKSKERRPTTEGVVRARKSLCHFRPLSVRARLRTNNWSSKYWQLEEPEAKEDYRLSQEEADKLNRQWEEQARADGWTEEQIAASQSCQKYDCNVDTEAEVSFRDAVLTRIYRQPVLHVYLIPKPVTIESATDESAANVSATNELATKALATNPAESGEGISQEDLDGGSSDLPGHRIGLVPFELNARAVLLSPLAELEKEVDTLQLTSFSAWQVASFSSPHTVNVRLRGVLGKLQPYPKRRQRRR